MVEELLSWAGRHWVEISGALLGVMYVFLSVKQNILTWLMGLLSSVLYIYVFFDSGFYADMTLQFYYVWISIYGWIIWARGKPTDQGKEALPVTNTSKKLAFILIVVSLILWALIWFILKKFTNSPIPVGDSFVTSLSIVATWMLARKIIEQWLVWILVDFVSLLLFLYKGLYPTSILYAIFTIVSVWGYFEWKKDLIKRANVRQADKNSDYRG
jgi:nicotinamide mononucleotide transporter